MTGIRAHDAPLSEVTVVTTARCNQRCSYCYVKRRRSASPPWPAVRQALDALLAAPVDEAQVALTGGEPLLARPLITRTVSYIRKRRRPDQAVHYKLLTNGLLLNARTLAWLERHAFELQISFDGVRDAQDFRSPGTFDTLDALLRTLARDRPAYLRSRVGIAMTVAPSMVPRLADSIAYLLDAGAPTIRMSPASGVPESGPDIFPELDRQFARIHRDALAHYRRTGHVPLADFRKGSAPPLRRLTSRWSCGAPVGRTLAVDVDGHVSTCLLATKTYADGRALPAALRKAALALRLGELDSDLEGQLAHTSARASEARVFSSSMPRHSSCGPCRLCRWSRDCFVCPLMTVGTTGTPRVLRVPSFQCAWTRAISTYRAAFPIQPRHSRV